MPFDRASDVELERPQKKKVLRKDAPRYSEDFSGFDPCESQIQFFDLERNDISFVYYQEGEKVITRKDLP